MCPGLLLVAACGGNAPSGGTQTCGPVSSATAASPTGSPTTDPAVVAICQKLVPDLRNLGRRVGSLVQSPQTFLTATTDLSKVLRTDLTALTDSAFKTTANGLATHIANVRTAIQGGHFPGLADVTATAANAQSLVTTCNANAAIPSTAASS